MGFVEDGMNFQIQTQISFKKADVIGFTIMVNADFQYTRDPIGF